MKPGIYYDVPFEDYRKIDAINASFLRSWFKSSPLHGKAYLEQLASEEAEPAEDHLTLGKLVHARLLEPDKPFPNIVLQPKQYPAPPCSSLVKSKKIAAGDLIDWNNNAEYCKSWRLNQQSEGKVVLTEDQYESVFMMVQAITRKPVASNFFSAGGDSEVVVVWEDPATKLKCKARLDFVPKGNCIVDVKTARTADPNLWKKAALDSGYHLQAAFYIMGWNEIVGKADPSNSKTTMVFVVVEKTAPYDVVVYAAGRETISEATTTINLQLQEWAKCLRKGKYSGRSDLVIYF